MPIYMYIFLILVAVVVYEFSHAVYRQYCRYSVYNQANALAKKINKPIMVIGDPYNGAGTKFFGQVYGCGDVCIDITGCPNCGNNTQKIAGKLEDVLDQFKSNSHVIFISYVLEYVDDIDKVWKSICRIAGTLDNIFLLTVSKYCLTAYNYKESTYKAKRVINNWDINSISYTPIE